MNGGRFVVRRLTPAQIVLQDTFRALGARPTMTAFVELDVTEARRRLRALARNGQRTSLFAFLVRSVAGALAETPVLNSVVRGNRVWEFEDIDISVPIEVRLATGARSPRQLVLRKVDQRSASDLTQEIAQAQDLFHSGGYLGNEDREAQRLDRLVHWVPGFVRRMLIRTVALDPLSVKRHSGTVFLTSVAGFSRAPGFVLPVQAGPKSAHFALGNVVRKPVVVGGEVQIRDLVSVTVMLNHVVVDGAPAARFLDRLQRLVESAEVLGPPPTA